MAYPLTGSSGLLGDAHGYSRQRSAGSGRTLRRAVAWHSCSRTVSSRAGGRYPPSGFGSNMLPHASRQSSRFEHVFDTGLAEVTRPRVIRDPVLDYIELPVELSSVVDQPVSEGCPAAHVGVMRRSARDVERARGRQAGDELHELTDLAGPSPTGSSGRTALRLRTTRRTQRRAAGSSWRLQGRGGVDPFRRTS